MLNLQRDQIQDRVVKETFLDIQKYVESEPILSAQFKHFEHKFITTGSALSFRHNLGFIPRDLLPTSTIGSGTVVWNYASFTEKEIFATVSGTVTVAVPTTVRFFLGRFS